MTLSIFQSQAVKVSRKLKIWNTAWGYCCSQSYSCSRNQTLCYFTWTAAWGQTLTVWHKQAETKASARQAERWWHTLHTDIKLAQQILARDDVGDGSFVDSVDNGFLPQCGVQSDHCNTHPLVATAVPEPPNSNGSFLANTAIFIIWFENAHSFITPKNKKAH